MLVTDPTDPDFESYCTVAEADQILAERDADLDWKCMTTIQKEVQLRLASEYLDNQYHFIGCKEDVNQPMSWPRSYTGLSDVLPSRLKKATAILGKDAKSLNLYDNVAGSTSNQLIKSSAGGLGPMSEDISYFKQSAGDTVTQNKFIEVKNIIRPLVQSDTLLRG